MRIRKKTKNFFVFFFLRRRRRRGRDGLNSINDFSHVEVSNPNSVPFAIDG